MNPLSEFTLQLTGSLSALFILGICSATVTLKPACDPELYIQYCLLKTVAILQRISVTAEAG